jgi:hypothetical protein
MCSTRLDVAVSTGAELWSLAEYLESKLGITISATVSTATEQAAGDMTASLDCRVGVNAAREGMLRH